MVARLRVMWETVRTGLWFVPLVMSVLAAALAGSLLTQPLSEEFSTWWLYRGTGQDASALLATLLAALIPMAALLVSITMVVLTLAAGQLGPRLIRNFMSDIQTQMTLGLFMATIVYLLIILGELREDMEPGAVPRLAVSVGMFLVLASVAALLFFVHMLARAIISDTMIGRIGADLDEAVDKQLPTRPERWTPDSVRPQGPARSLAAQRNGYVQTVDYDHLVKRAADLDVVVELLFRPGHYLVKGTHHILVWGAEEAVERAGHSLRKEVILGDQRNAAQDLEFSARQLVEIALRALSPGINDEFSAIAAIDRLGGCLAGVIGRPGMHRVLCDPDGKPRLIRPVSSFAGLCGAAFDQIRQASGGHPAVQMRLIEIVGALLSLAERPGERQVLVLHLDMVLESARRGTPEPWDLKALEERHRKARGGEVGHRA
ncbi:DUF2254 domain-containing protein [Novispirillum sp. DQ9]|uniref:DUF2254 domain-containing protein n=1 Tax=Novispirillum sp. DQ9 TaxID=3398612 RepID=UPI003C7CB2BD